MSGYVEIALDRPRRLHYDTNAICDLEEKLGKPISAALDSQSAGFSMVRALLWAGIKHEDKGMTIERTGRILNDYIVAGGSQQALGDRINQALKASGLFGRNGEDGDGKEGNAKAEAAQ